MNLTEITGGGLLDAPAAAQWELLAEAFAEVFGAPPSVTSAWRSREEQEELYDRYLTEPGAALAAAPGLSLHEYGRALDLGSGVNIGGSVQHQWMRTHAPAYGWAVGTIRTEPWHITYTLTPTITSRPDEEDTMHRPLIVKNPKGVTMLIDWQAGTRRNLTLGELEAHKQNGAKVVDLPAHVWDETARNLKG